MQRRGLTIVQLLIGIVLVVLIVGLIVPLVLNARVRAARTETTDNLRKCAFAVHGFHDTYRKLPDAYLPGETHNKQPVSLWFRLLPYVGEKKVYDTGIVDAVVPAFQAASDRGIANRAGIVNFAGNVRVFAYESINPSKVSTVGTALNVPRGLLRSNLTLPRIVDGTANAMMMSTRYAKCADQTTWYAADPHGAANIGAFPSPGVGGFMGAGAYTTSPTSGREPLTAMFQLVPSVQDCVPQDSIFGHSFDTAGLIVAMCDASVKTISPTMTPQSIANAIRPNDDAPLGQDWHIE